MHCTKLEIQSAAQIVISLNCTERESDAHIQPLKLKPCAHQQEPRIQQHLPPLAEATNSPRPEPRCLTSSAPRRSVPPPQLNLAPTSKPTSPPPHKHALRSWCGRLVTNALGPLGVVATYGAGTLFRVIAECRKSLTPDGIELGRICEPATPIAPN